MAATNKVQKTLSVDLGALLDAGDGAVVTLVAGDTRLAAHRAVLAAKSPVFTAMFSHDTLEATSGEVTIADVDGPVLRQLVAYMYTCTPPQLPDMAPQLLAAADKYGLSALKAACEQQMATQLTVENAAATAMLAARHSCPILTKATIGFIKANFIWVTSTKGWAHAVRSQPEDVIEVTRRLSEPPAEIRNLPAEEKGRKLRKGAEEGAVEDMRSLLVAGTDVEARDEDGKTASHIAAWKGQVEAVKCLLENGAEVDARTNRQSTPLCFAAAYGHLSVVQLLVASSANVNMSTDGGMTPLHWAACNGHADVAAALLDAGADAGASTDDGKTPLDIARHNNHKQIVELLS